MLAPQLLSYFTYSLYIISDSVSVLQKAVDDGASIVQLRDKTGSNAELYRKAQSMVQYKKNKDFLFMVNDDPELALKVKADGVHIGQDYATQAAREIVGEELILGKSISSLEDGLKAEQEGADYVALGPIFFTPLKAQSTVVGLAVLKEAVEKINLPLVAIGGINLNNVKEVLTAGAKTVCVIRAAKDTKALLKLIDAYPKKM